MELFEEMVQILGQYMDSKEAEEAACRIEDVVLRRFGKLWETVLVEVKERIEEIVRDSECYEEAKELIAESSGIDVVYEVLLCMFRGCLE